MLTVGHSKIQRHQSNTGGVESFYDGSGETWGLVMPSGFTEVAMVSS